LYQDQYSLLKTQGIIHFEGYSLDRARWQLRWGDESVALTRKTFDLLLYLIDHHDQVVSKDELLQSLWSKQVVEEGNLNQQVFLLRKALSHHGPGKIIETVPGRGYRFTAKLEPPTSASEDEVSTVVIHDRHSITRVTIDESVEDAPAEPATSGPSAGASPNPGSNPTQIKPSAPAPTTPNALRSSVDWVVVSALLCALAALAVLGWHFWQNRSTGEPVEVVVTDLVGTGDPVLDRALDQALRVDLSQSPFLTVVSPSEVRATLADMKQPESTTLTLPLAREVCERNSAQVVLQAAVSKFGQHYLVTLLASNCVSEPTAHNDAIHDEEVLAQAKEEVQQLDDLPHALGVIAADIRKSLGESRASLRRFDQPLRAASTSSLAALKAYSEAYRLGLRGDWLGALPLLQHSIELDPQFALAYFDLAATYGNLHDIPKERAALTKAYELRGSVPEVEQFLITALYHSVITGDVAKSIETYKTWANLYPRSAEAYGNLAEEYDSMGQANLGVAPARRAVELRPNDTSTYQDLALTLLHSGQPKAAQQTCELAIKKNLDGEDIRHDLLLAMYAQNDAVGVAAQLDWGRHHPDSLRLHADEISIALSKGELQRAQVLITQLRAKEYPPELAAEYQSGRASVARALAEMGLTTESLALLQSLPQTTLPDRDALVALAEDEDAAQADKVVQPLAQEHGQETLWKSERIPEIRAALSLAKREPQAAVSALEAALPFDGLTFGPAYLRGKAYMAWGKVELAQTEFRKITDRLYIDPLSSEYPLAVLASARVYALQNQPDNAREQFERFFDLWKTADADLPLLQAAHSEYDSSTTLDVTLRP
jgi:eukaryotic-like serine/threonine-protein kinase